GDDGGDGLRSRGLAEERHRNAGSIEEIADEPEAAAAPDVVGDDPRRALAFSVVTFDTAAAEQTAGIEILPLRPEIPVDVRVVDRTVDGGRVGASDDERPDGELPIAHVQRNADRRAELVLVAGEQCKVLDLDPRGVAQ